MGAALSSTGSTKLRALFHRVEEQNTSTTTTTSTSAPSSATTAASGGTITTREDDALAEYTSLHFADIDGTFTAFVRLFGYSKMLINGNEFDIIFAPLLGDTDLHFSIWQLPHRATACDPTESLQDVQQQENSASAAARTFSPAALPAMQSDVASAYAIFATMYLLACKSDVMVSAEARISKILNLFDLDRSGKMNFAELNTCLLLTALGVTQMGNFLLSRAQQEGKDGTASATTRMPKFQCSPIASKAQLQLKLELNRECAMTEVLHCLSRMPDIATFLEIFRPGTALVAAQQHQIDVGVDLAVDLFLKHAAGSHPPCVGLEAVRDILEQLPGAKASPEEVEFFVTMLDEGGLVPGERDDTVYMDEFLAGIVPWVSYSCVDVDFNGKVDHVELKNLLWLCSGIDAEEPSARVVRLAFDRMDLNANEFIDRSEFIKYCSTYDHGSGAFHFTQVARSLWKSIDKDGSRCITWREIADMIHGSLVSFVESKQDHGMQLPRVCVLCMCGAAVFCLWCMRAGETLCVCVVLLLFSPTRLGIQRNPADVGGGGGAGHCGAVGCVEGWDGRLDGLPARVCGLCGEGGGLPHLCEPGG